MSENYKAIGSLYMELLKRDTSDYEEETRGSRMQRLDATIVDGVKSELQENGVSKAVEALDLLKNLDKYIVTNGGPDLAKAERLAKAYAFFETDPTQLVEFIDMYFEARAEAWQS